MKRHLLPLVAMLTLLSSCSHCYYAPNTHNVPEFKEKGEARLSGFITNSEAPQANISGKRNGDIQAGYAVTNHFALIANATLMQPLISPTEDGRGHLYEFGAGYFKPIRFNKKDSWYPLVFEIYGVAGMGGYRNFYWDSTGYTDENEMTNAEEFKYPDNYITTNFVKAYIQPSISFSHDIVDLIVSMKFGGLHTYSVTTTLPNSILTQYTSTGEPGNDWEIVNDNRTTFLFEPAFTLRIGYQYVKGQIQFSFSTISDPALRNVACPLTFGGGISIDIAHRFFEKKSKNILPGPETEGK